MLYALMRNWWALALRGGVAILFGAATLARPGVTLVTFVVVFGAFALADGAFAVVAALANRTRHESRWLLFIEGIVSVAAGFAGLSRPGVSAVALLYLIAARAVLTGCFEILAALALRKELDGEWLLALSGLISVLIGALLALRPAGGALALLRVIGGSAIAVGALQLVLAVRLRRLRRRMERTLSRAA